MGLLPTISITGAAVASCLGRSLGVIHEKLLVGIRGLSKDHRFQDWTDAPLGELPWDLFGVVPGDLEQPDRVARRIVFSLVDELERKTKVFSRYDKHRIGLFLGTSTCGIKAFENAVSKRRTTQIPLSRTMTLEMQHGWIADEVTRQFPIGGFSQTFSTACSSSALAIAHGYDAVRSGMLDACIAGGIDILSPITIMGFDSLQVLDHSFTKPFQANRAGINLSEGGGLLLLERTGEEVLGRILGYGAQTEAHHMTHPSPGGEIMELAMVKALEQSGVAAADISYVNAHGTGTIANDEAEGQAIHRLFADRALFHSTKEFHGHTLAGSGALELAVTLAVLNAWPQWQGKRGNSNEPTALCNSFAFGGNNVSLCVAGGRS
ncbi:MAG: beta-ketoacyl synthase N-terminal-like domain-containing protein [Oligoflexales bacterium]